MESLPALFSDLALILVTAGLTTVIFKWLKQPVVLGYIIAGFIIGPNFEWFPVIQDHTSVETWSEIGMVFMLFGIGLEFSFKKLKKVGGTVGITALTELVTMCVVGFLLGKTLGWSQMDSIFLGAMLSISSTTIIAKAFDDMKLHREKFSGNVIGELVVEDLEAVLLMVILSTLAVSQSFNGMELVTSMLKLAFFLLVWFFGGIFLVPTVLKWSRKFMSEETLTVFAVGLCFLMVVLANLAGYSSALGAFIMGSILAETLEAEAIHKLTTPNFEGFVMPADCQQPRYVVAKSVTATLDFAGVMADAARLFAPYQKDYPGFVKQATEAAERAYQWAKDQPNACYRQEQLKDPAVSTGTYGDGNARDEFFWASSALFRLTRKPSYQTDARQYQPQRFSTPSWGNVSALGTFEWLADEEQRMTADGLLLMTQLLVYCEEAVKGADTSCFQSPFGNSSRNFGWGCLAENCCCQAFVLLCADQLSGTTKYRRYALQNADYLLGRNATGYCYVTGFGDKSPMHPHHRISEADNVEAPFPGMLVGGPNPGQQDKRDMKTAVYPSNHPDESYIDNMESYASNEIAINWNASLVAFLCTLDALKM